MSFKNCAEVTLSSAVATAGTITFSYPTGFGRGNFVGGVKHILGVGAKASSRVYYNAGKDFNVSLGASSITVTWRRSETIPAGSVAVLQLDMEGIDGRPDEVVLDTRVQRMDGGMVLINLGAPAAASATYFRAAAAVGGAGNLTLLQTTLDVPRALSITSTGADNGRTFTATGTDEFGNTMVEAITGPNTTTVNGKKAFKTISTISVDAACAGNISIGFSDVLGLPVYLPSAGHILRELEDDATATAGTTVGGLSHATQQSATAADVRGTYDPNSAADGSKTFQLLVFLGNPSYRGPDQYAG